MDRIIEKVRVGVALALGWPIQSKGVEDFFGIASYCLIILLGRT